MSSTSKPILMEWRNLLIILFRAYVSRKTHEVQRAGSNLDCALSREKAVRVGLLILQKKGLQPNVVEELRKDVVTALLSAVRYYLLAGAYENTRLLLTRSQVVTWLSEEEEAELKIGELKVKLVDGHLEEVEPRAQDWLRLCKERGWRNLQTTVARLLSTLAKLSEG